MTNKFVKYELIEKCNKTTINRLNNYLKKLNPKGM